MLLIMKNFILFFTEVISTCSYWGGEGSSNFRHKTIEIHSEESILEREQIMLTLWTATLLILIYFEN